MMKRFFLIPLLVLTLLLAGCTCSARGNISTPTKAPSAAPTMTAAPVVTQPPVPSMMPEDTVAPVMPTEPAASPSAGATAGN
ncbi:MAG: hypothetical protein IJL62_09170 [Clostridia bacterium]|nr:hypothetical protein [Clostridia bacterium]